jgi:hypothetical protein
VAPSDLGIFGFVLVASAAVLWLNLGRALLWVRPKLLTLEADAPADQVKVPDELTALARELSEQGFVFLGTHQERSPARPVRTCWDFAAESSGTFATLDVSRAGERQLVFFTRTADDAFVLTANHRRPVRADAGRYEASYLENVNVARLFKAHQRVVGERKGEGPMTLEGRVDAAQAWLAGPGRVEIRQQHLSGLLWTLSTVGMVAGAVFGRG